MTLIAGFKSMGTPVLIGDFLITKNGVKSGLRKKILKITDRFVLAWTGHLLAANEVVEKLKNEIKEDHVSLEYVQSILTGTAFVDLGKLKVIIICWVVDENGQHCFRWRSDYPSEIFTGDPMSDGSGDLLAEAIHGTKGLTDSSVNDGVNQSLMLFATLSVTAQLMNYEMIGPSPEKEFGFGFAYEILFLNSEDKFEYLSNILYLGVICYLDENGNYVNSKQVGNVYKYEALGNVTKLCVQNVDKKEITINIISPPGTGSTVNSESVKWTGYKSDYYCIGLRIERPGYQPLYSCLIDDIVDNGNRVIKIDDHDRAEITINPRAVEDVHKHGGVII